MIINIAVILGTIALDMSFVDAPVAIASVLWAVVAVVVGSMVAIAAVVRWCIVYCCGGMLIRP